MILRCLCENLSSRIRYAFKGYSTQTEDECFDCKNTVRSEIDLIDHWPECTAEGERMVAFEFRFEDQMKFEEHLKAIENTENDHSVCMEPNWNKRFKHMLGLEMHRSIHTDLDVK